METRVEGRVTVSRAKQLPKVLLFSSVTPSGTAMSVRALQLKNASPSTSSRAGISTRVMLSHQENTLSSMTVTLSGTVTLVRLPHS